MRRTITALSLLAVSTLALASCATEDHTQHGALPAPAGTHTGHSAPSPSASEDHSEHTASVSPKASTSASEPEDEHSGHHSDNPNEPVDPDDPGGRGKPHKDDSFKVIKLDKGTTYTIQSSTDATKFRLTIESFGCKAKFPNAGRTDDGDPAQFQAGPGKQLCVAVVSGKNVGKAPDWAALNYFASVVTDNGDEYQETDSPNFTTRFLVKDKAPLDESVDPGNTGWMALGYEVPASAQGLSLRIDTAPPSH